MNFYNSVWNINTKTLIFELDYTLPNLTIKNDIITDESEIREKFSIYKPNNIKIWKQKKNNIGKFLLIYFV